MMSENQKTNNDLLCVGLGYSESDFDSVKLFFRQLKTTTAACFLLVKEDQRNPGVLNTDALASCTTHNICLAIDQMPLQPQTIYLIPLGMNASIFQGKIMLTPHIYHHTLNQPLLALFEALLNSYGSLATGIVFAGCSTAGKQALKIIGASHGLAFIQDASHFKHYDPCYKDTSALEIQQVEQLLLEQSRKHERRESPEKNDTKRWFPEIWALLQQKTGIDYSGYKSNTLERKTEHRMRMAHCATAKDYLGLLQSNDNEIKLLSGEFRITVTRFFRNPEVFAYINNHIFSSLVSGNKEPIHIWIAACSSGEEAYSLAMLWDEYAQNISPQPMLKIWASDIDLGRLQQARKGVYPESISHCIPPHYLNTCFIQQGDHYQVKPHIQNMIQFVRHNLVTDPPLAGMHLICCRNLLIYLNPQTQSLVLEKLTETLNVDGYLILGKKETPGKLLAHFEVPNAHLKIYQKKKNLQKTRRSFLKNTLYTP